MSTNSVNIEPRVKAVSRSFYLSLRVLPKGARAVMELGYLLCRAADSIADTDSLPAEERLRTLQRWDELVSKFPMNSGSLENFAGSLQEKISSPASAEGNLLIHLGDIFKAALQLSRTDQSLIQEIVHAVLQGMMMDLSLFGDSSENLKAFFVTGDLETYIGWIGGSPGHFWTKVCLEHFPRLKIKDQKKWLEDAFQFGTGLQMINILRDLPNDLRKGRCYIPLEMLKKNNLTPEDLLDKEKSSSF